MAALPTCLYPRPIEGLTAQEKTQLREVFDLVDQDGSEQLDWVELRGALRGIGFAITKKAARRMLRSVDNNRDGLIGFDEFIQIIEQLSRSEVDIKTELVKGFALLAKGKKKISFESLKQISQELDEYLSHEELRAMLHVASSAGDGSVSLEDFVKAMLKTNLFR